ncbi:MAG: PIN domain nuclease [Bryobacterales bacterium]|nr:PIN domain nuclease [Bryobacterales bacterium]
MILVDSSVWIDYLRGIPNPTTDQLERLLGQEEIAIGDLMLAEVLQGISDDKTFETVRALLCALPVVPIGGRDTAIAAARNFRLLRRKGITVRKTIDTLIATCCLEHGCELLHNDRDFDAFARHLGLRVVC